MNSIRNVKSDLSPLSYFEYTYTPGGNVSSIRRENADVIYYEYDFRSRLREEKWYNAAMQSIYAYHYDYDGAGNRTRKACNDANVYYEYDNTNQLTRAHDTPSDTWTYFKYDGRGNCEAIQESTGTTYFTYSDRDLVTEIKYPGGIMNYFRYDGRLRRYAIQDSDGLTYFTWDTNGMNLLAERAADGTVTRKYTHGPSPVPGIGSLVEAEDAIGSAFKYAHMDMRGSVFGTTDASEDAKDTYNYNAWGEIIHEELSGMVNRYGYQSNWLTLKDSAGRLCLSPTRLYHAEVGAFLQNDHVIGLDRCSAFFGNPLPLAAANGRDPKNVHGGTDEDDDEDPVRRLPILILIVAAMSLGRRRPRAAGDDAAGLGDKPCGLTVKRDERGEVWVSYRYNIPPWATRRWRMDGDGMVHIRGRIELNKIAVAAVQKQAAKLKCCPFDWSTWSDYFKGRIRLEYPDFPRSRDVWTSEEEIHGWEKQPCPEDSRGRTEVCLLNKRNRILEKTVVQQKEKSVMRVPDYSAPGGMRTDVFIGRWTRVSTECSFGCVCVRGPLRARTVGEKSTGSIVKIKVEGGYLEVRRRTVYTTYSYGPIGKEEEEGE